MRVIVVGATGTIGREVVAALKGQHQVIEVGHSRGDERVDLTDPTSIRELYRRTGPVDAVVCAAGQAAFKPLVQLTDADFEFSLRNKLMGQVNLARYGLSSLRDGGSMTLTSGILSQQPMPGSAAISLVNAGLEGFVRALALEAPRGIRANVVSPGWVSETLKAMGRDPSEGTPAAEVARVYVASVEGKESGATLIAKR
jgi:NAD(P)-dependent dehydrogenase (short-subunit alcohol dehydrogenase family)